MPLKKTKNMSARQKRKLTAKMDYRYPDKTNGSEIAAKTRKVANRWTEAERAALFERGMQIIYGGSASKTTVHTRH
jgi:hypothetical protein